MKSPRLTTNRRRSTFALILLSGLVAIAGWMAVGAFAYRQYLIPGTVHFGFVFWHDEIVFVQREFQGHIGTGAYPTEVMSLNPRTGIVRRLGIPETDIGMLIPDGDRLWMLGRSTVVVTDGNTVTRFDPEFAINQPFFPPIQPFLLNGQLTTIDPRFENPRLLTIVEGRWKLGPRIVLPGPGQVWGLEEERNRTRLIQHTGNRPTSKFGQSFKWIQARQIGNDVHVIYTSYVNGTKVMAYRMGFEFVLDPSAVSAPENAPPEATGWHRLDPDKFGSNLTLCNVGGEFVLQTDTAPFLWKAVASQPGQFEPITTGLNTPVIIVPALRKQDVHLMACPRHRTQNLFRLDGDRFVQTPHSLPGTFDTVVARERTAAWLAIAVWIISALILFCGAVRRTRRQLEVAPNAGNNNFERKICSSRTRESSEGRGKTLNSHESGDKNRSEVELLGPLGRRWLARGMDLSVMFAPLLVVAFWALWFAEPLHLCSCMAVTISWVRLLPTNNRFSFSHIPLTREETLFVAGAYAWIAACFLTFVVTQSLWGVTLGKWICQLRVVQANLRPCGVFRSLLREMMVFADTLLFITPIPAIASILLTTRRQRLGDLLAGTVVIDVRSTLLEFAD